MKILKENTANEFAKINTHLSILPSEKEFINTSKNFTTILTEHSKFKKAIEEFLG